MLLLIIESRKLKAKRRELLGRVASEDYIHGDPDRRQSKNVPSTNPTTLTLPGLAVATQISRSPSSRFDHSGDKTLLLHKGHEFE